MGAKFKGMTPEMLSRRMRSKARGVSDAIADVLDETVTEASDNQRLLLDAATTTYGSQRFSRGQGRSAGRNDSGDMIRATGQRVFRRGRTQVGQWGWIGEVPDYIKYQELGTGKIPAARSLLDSYVKARADFIRRLRLRLVRR